MLEKYQAKGEVQENKNATPQNVFQPIFFPVYSTVYNCRPLMQPKIKGHFIH